MGSFFSSVSLWPSPPSTLPLSPSLPPLRKDGESRNWAELPPELTISILLRLGPTFILESAQKVCKPWRRLCKDPSMWRKIDTLDGYPFRRIMDYGMIWHAVDYSQGGLIEISLGNNGTDELLNYVAKSSSNLRSLKLVTCYQLSGKGLVEAAKKLPWLEDLEFSHSELSGETLKVFGQSCPNLKSLKLNCTGYFSPRIECNDKALAIADTMPRLRHLQLLGNRLTDGGLIAVLDNCPDLEHLDLRQCFNVNIVGDLEKRCFERIRVVKRPKDSTQDYPYNAIPINDQLPEDDRIYDDDTHCYESDSSHEPYEYDHNDYLYYDDPSHQY